MLQETKTHASNLVASVGALQCPEGVHHPQPSYQQSKEPMHADPCKAYRLLENAARGALVTVLFALLKPTVQQQRFQAHAT